MRACRRLLALSLAAACAAICGCAGEERPPNLVLVIVDTLRADRLGAYGFPKDTSPELDAYARRGARFDFALAQGTWTRPSIGSMLTSRYPRTLGIYNERGEILSDRFDTLAELLGRHGYTTLGVTANPNINSHFNFDQGFDRYLDSGVVMEWMQAADARGKRGEGGQWLSPARDVFRSVLDELGTLGPPPYYVQINLMDVHEFHDPRVPVDAEVAELFADEPDARERRYLRAIRVVSRETDRFIRRLEQDPAWAHTLFVITSDHGETIDDHPGLSDPKWHGHLVYESQARVPLILYGAGGRLPRGRVIERPVRLLDLVPTFLDYARVPPPEGLEGVSLLPLLRDPGARIGIPETIVVETRFRKARKLAAYAAKWKYVENRDAHDGTNPRALQAVGAPEDGARTDAAASHPEELERLAKFLGRWEASHPEAEPTLAERAPPDEMVDQLRALGYAE
jgi:arylsulfatase A-like enzyme